MVHISEFCVACLFRKFVLIPVQTRVSFKLANDSQRFLLEYFDIIQDSPSQIYHCALPLYPPSSWLYKCYSAELSPEVKVIKGLPDDWGMCSRTVTLDSFALALACWKDTIAAGLVSGEIVTLDGVTGSQTAILPGHAKEVKSLAFSPDGASLVSGSSDRTIKLWDVQTGGVVKTFHGHTAQICSVSISGDSTTIASGSADRTVHLWDIQKEECHYIIQHQYDVHHVKFSSTDPQHLMSVSGDVVWRWDTNG